MKTFEEVLAGVAEEALHHELQTIFGLGLFRLSPSDDTYLANKTTVLIERMVV